MTDTPHGVSLGKGSFQTTEYLPATDDLLPAPGPRLVSQSDLVTETQTLQTLAQQILESSDDCIKVLDLEGHILFMSPGGQAALGVQDVTPLLDTSWFDFWQPSEKPAVMAAIAKAKAGEVCSLQGFCPTLQGEPKWWDNKVSPIRGADGQVERILCISRDITQRKRIEDERKQAELNAQFLAKISQDLVEAASVDEIIRTVGQQLHDYLNVSACAFVEVNEAENTAIIAQDWHQKGVLSLVGVYPLPKFVTGEFFQTARVGRTIVVQDVTADPRIVDQQKFLALQIGSFINVPLIRDGEWKFTFGVYHSTPYYWRNDEIELMRELANRIWTKLERTRFETALRKSEEEYRSLFNSMDEGFCILQLLFDERQNPLDYRFIEVNSIFEQQTGLKHAQGKTILELVPNIEAFWLDTYGKIALNGEPMRFVNYSEVMGRWFDVNAFRVGEPHEHKVALLFKDISDRKQAEQALRESEEWARLAIQVARLGGWRLHLDTQLVEMDERMREIWGEPEDAVLVPLPQVLGRMHPDDRDRVAGAVTAAIDPHSSGMYEIEYRIIWDNGTERWVLAKGQAQFEGTGASRRTVDFFGTLLDITERKQVEAEREQLLAKERAAREEAEQANRIKDEFLAVLSHELRSPLNPILGWTKLLQTRQFDEAARGQALKTIERNAKLQTQLIDDLLDVSRILRGKMLLDSCPVDLETVIDAALETVRLSAEAKGIEIQKRVTGEVGCIAGDSGRLQQVIWNLLSNAVKFTPSGGKIEICLQRIGSEAQIQVKDTGKGITPEFLPFIFDYFRQEDGATTRKFGGLGLGLAIVRHLVELHGGTVSVESPGVGMGSTFTIKLPLMLAQAVTQRNCQPQGASPDLNGLQVLVVDDETDSREFVAFVLEQAGALVTTTGSADEALAAFTQAKPDVLLSDIAMPDMDGYMLMQRIRALPVEHGGQVLAIALTAYAGEVNQKQAQSAGFNKHIAKPIEPEVLVQEIFRLVHT